MYVIGTAGHVDHGKSSLVEALTGIDPDRLAEEKAREMTIDLGFAWLTLQSADGRVDEEVGVIDVPGHRDFIENMLAGIGSVDLALLVVAADEGVMPQTREHLAILDLLEVRGGIVALTKVDLIDDPEWLDLVKMEVGEVLAGTALAGAPILPVSARTGHGLPALKEALLAALLATPPRVDVGRPRLWVDRVFTLSGFGTVVTGTLSDGRFRVGDHVEIQPQGLRARIRGLQTHKTKREVAQPGSRVAVNLTGVDREDVRRGHVLAAPGVAQATILLDAVYRHLPDAGVPLKHNESVKVFIGAAEVMGRTRLLGARRLEPGAEGWLQLALSAPLAAVRGDRFILRRPSPGTTLGGGRVLDPHPGRRHRRFRQEVVARLETLRRGTPAELLLQALQRLEPITLDKLWAQAGLEQKTAAAAWDELLSQKQVALLEQYAVSRAGRQRLLERMAMILNEYHRQNPLRIGMSREELRSRIKLPPPIFQALVGQAAAAELLVERGTVIHAPGHTIRFNKSQQTAVDQLLQRMAGAGINSPSVKEVKTAVGEEVYAAVIDLGTLVQVADDVVYSQDDYRRFTGRIEAYLADTEQSHGRINAAQVRDMFGTSRKYAIALLEHLDQIKVTRRVGDERQLHLSKNPQYN
jgi:selenocysteine-specific elongation factor